MPHNTQTNDKPFQNHPTLPIAIVGGGLCGLALAIGLVKHGINVQIFEAAPAFSEIGAGVAFGVNSIKALQLIDPQLLKGYKKHATFNADRQRDKTFYTMRWGTDEKKNGGRLAGDFAWNLDDVWHFERTQEMGVRTRSCIHRARLLEELVALLPHDITTFGKTFERADSLPDGTLKLYFSDGTNALASAVVGCDGVKSRVRSLVCPQEVQPRYAGECAYRAVVPKADAEAVLENYHALNGHIYCGYGGYIITYPIEHGDLVNMVAIPHDNGNAETWQWEQNEWTVPTTKAEFEARFEGWYKPLVEVFSRFLIPTKWALFVLQHSTPYFKDHVCIVGDAAHATVPHLGAGAGMAMEDAYVLSSLIASIGGIDDIESAFQAYDAARRPRTQECIQRSLDASISYGLGMDGVEDDVGKVKEGLEKSYEWLWHEELETQLDVAVKLQTACK